MPFRSLTLFSLLAVATVCGSPVAHADNVQDFAVQAELSDGYTAWGFIRIDTTTGEYLPSNFTFSRGASVFSFSTPYTQQGDANFTFAQFPALDASGEEADLFLLLPDSLTGYTGGPICSGVLACPDGYSSGAYLFDTDGNLLDEQIDVLSGNLVATPEPSSVLLLGTGLLGVVGWMRKRFLPASMP